MPSTEIGAGVIRNTNIHCPTTEDLSWALTMGVPPELEAHLKKCPKCAAEFAALGYPGEIAREMPSVALSHTSRQRLRAKVLSGESVPVPRRRNPTFIRVGFTLAAASAVCAAVMLWPSATPVVAPSVLSTAQVSPPLRAPLVPTGKASVERGRLHAHPGAAFVRVNDQPDEIVRLNEGKLTVEVKPLQAGERFRVVVGDGEVEVHGTAFDVEASDDRLMSVRVLHGVVEVRFDAKEPVLLKAGDRWARPAPMSAPRILPKTRVALALPRPSESVGAPAVHHEAAPPPLKDPVAVPTPFAPPVPAAPTATRVTPGPSPAELAFQEGWLALKSASPDRAAASFGRAAQNARGTALEEDARFWYGVSLARSGQVDAAGKALGDFIDTFPHSVRRGEASAVLGWLQLKAGKLAAAERLFGTANRDTVVRVRQSGQKGLDAVKVRRSRDSHNIDP
ncbi:MAG: FecR domain-containing protein [Deltaproteobacteria bacterium]|nr:FecR domain-containing protein [Deltaproteobacteria bacterium]